MANEIQKVTFNGKSGGPQAVSPWIAALNDARIVQEKAGFIFKTGLRDDHIVLAVEPSLINGERRYHFNMRIAGEDAYTLIGNVDAQGVFTILFHPKSREIPADQRTRYLDTYRAFARLLSECGYRGAGELDTVTQGLLKRLGLHPAPASLDGLAAT